MDKDLTMMTDEEKKILATRLSAEAGRLMGTWARRSDIGAAEFRARREQMGRILGRLVAVVLDNAETDKDLIEAFGRMGEEGRVIAEEVMPSVRVVNLTRQF